MDDRWRHLLDLIQKFEAGQNISGYATIRPVVPDDVLELVDILEYGRITV